MPRKPISRSGAPKLRPGVSAGDDDRADALGAGVVVEPAVDEVVVGVAAVGDPALVAVDHDVVAVAAALGPHVGRGRPGVRLGDADGHGDLAGRPPSAGSACFCSSVPKNSMTRHRSDVRLEDLERRGTALLGQLLLDDERVEQGAAVAAVLLGDRDAEEAEVGEALDLLDRQRGALAVPLSASGRVALAGDLGRQLAQLLLLGGQVESPARRLPAVGDACWRPVVDDNYDHHTDRFGCVKKSSR